MLMTKDEVVEIVFRTLPYHERITKLDTMSEVDAIRFSWLQGRKFRVAAGSLHVEEVKGGCLEGTTAATLIQALLKMSVKLEQVN